MLAWTPSICLNLRSVGFGLVWHFLDLFLNSFYRASRQEDLQQSGWKKDTLKLEKDVKNESLTEVVGWTD